MCLEFSWAHLRTSSVGCRWHRLGALWSVSRIDLVRPGSWVLVLGPGSQSWVPVLGPGSRSWFLGPGSFFLVLGPVPVLGPGCPGSWVLGAGSRSLVVGPVPGSWSWVLVLGPGPVSRSWVWVPVLGLGPGSRSWVRALSSFENILVCMLVRFRSHSLDKSGLYRPIWSGPSLSLSLSALAAPGLLR